MSAPPLCGRTLGHDIVVDQIGAGGMGVAYRARDTRLGRIVALKVLSPGVLAGAARRRIADEARAAAATRIRCSTRFATVRGI